MKYRTGFVTNSSSANYCVTVKLEDSHGETLRVEAGNYTVSPWYEDKKDGFELDLRRIKSLRYDINAGSIRKETLPADLHDLSDLLLGRIIAYGYGYGYDWWLEDTYEDYFRASWLRGWLTRAAEQGIDENDLVDQPEYYLGFDVESYQSELKRQGKALLREEPPSYRVSLDDICKGWRFAIAGKPRLYWSRDSLEEYIVSHGGVVDERMGTETDFLIWCGNGSQVDCEDEPYWLYIYEKHEPSWGIWTGAHDHECGTFEEFLASFESADGVFEKYFDRPVDGGYSEDWGEDVSYGSFVIPEAEFIRRFDPQHDRADGVHLNIAYPLLTLRLAQVLRKHGVNPADLGTVTYSLSVNTSGDSYYELGYYWKDEGVAIDLKTGEETRWKKQR